MNHIKLYTTTKGKKEDCLLYKCLKDYNYYKNELVCGFAVHFKENNTESLHKCYNDFLNDARNNKVDTAIFIHDDVYINTRDIYNLVTDASKKYQIFGLAGSTTCKIGNPALWHLMSERSDHRGCVAHGSPDQYSYTSFGPVPSRCLLIDGVFIGINIKQLPENVKFDESYPSKWHYYDLDFCLECNKNGVKIGVVDIPIIHFSPGLTNPDEEFYKGQEYFIKKWKK